MFNDNDPRIFRSDDRGETWTSIGDDLPSGAINDVVIYTEYEDSILFAASNIGVYATIDAGENWDRLGETLPYVPVRDMVINEINNEIVAGTYGNSINSYPIDSIIAVFTKSDPVRISEELLVEINLFPNPLADQTLTIQSEKALSIKIFNNNGKKILERKASKNHIIESMNISPGSYFVQFYDVQSRKTTSRSFIKQ